MTPVGRDSPCPAAAPTPRRPALPAATAGRAFASALGEGEDQAAATPTAALALPGLPPALPLQPVACMPSVHTPAAGGLGATAPKPATLQPVTSQVSAAPSMPTAPGLPAAGGAWQLDLGRGLPAAQLDITRHADGQLGATLTAALPAQAAAATRRLGQRLAERGVRLQHAAAAEPACDDTAATAAPAPTPPSGRAHA